MKDYSKYIEMDFKKEYKCPFTKLEVGRCWDCQQFDYCVNRRSILDAAGIPNIDYQADVPKWLLKEPKGFFDPGRFAISDNYVSSSFLGSSACRKRGYSD